MTVYSDRVTLMKTLQAEGETFESFRKDVRDQTIETFMRSKNIAQEIVISPYKVENYYQTHQDDFKVEDEIKLRMIVLNKTSTDDTNTVNWPEKSGPKSRQGAVRGHSHHIFAGIGTQPGRRPRLGGAFRSPQGTAEAGRAAPGQVSDVVDLPESCCLLLVEAAHPATSSR